jgi:predicted nucleic acid-binding protein
MRSGAIVDTNLTEKIFFPNDTKRFYLKELKLINRLFILQHNVVSLVEYARGAILKKSIKNQIHKTFLDSNTLYPTLNNWKLSLYLLQEMLEGNHKINKDYIRKMQMDALIASIALENNLTIITNDNDFFNFKKLVYGKKLKVYQPKN